MVLSKQSGTTSSYVVPLWRAIGRKNREMERIQIVRTFAGRKLPLPQIQEGTRRFYALLLDRNRPVCVPVFFYQTFAPGFCHSHRLLW